MEIVAKFHIFWVWLAIVTAFIVCLYIAFRVRKWCKYELRKITDEHLEDAPCKPYWHPLNCAHGKQFWVQSPNKTPLSLESSNRLNCNCEL